VQAERYGKRRLDKPIERIEFRMKRLRKTLIIGIDGANWTVLDKKVLEEHMPNLNRLVSEGTSGVLRSTDPPITPAAWSTCLTGCNPARHGLVGLQAYSFEDNRIYLTNSTHRVAPTMWNYFSKAGLKVGSVCVPFTWPTEPVNGIMVAGLGCPDTGSDFTYPPEFGLEILRAIPGFKTMFKHPKEIALGSDRLEVVRGGLADAVRSFEERTQIARMVCEKIDPDILFVEFQDLDWLQHVLWRYMDPATRDLYPAFRDAFFGLYRRLDDLISELLRLAGDDAFVVVVSDHGLGPVNWCVNVNLLLRQWGYLPLPNTYQRVIRRIRRSLYHLRGEQKRRFPLHLKKWIYWEGTRALMPFGGSAYGFIYLNVKGRQPYGCVEAGAEYDKLIQELRERFAELRNPENGQKCFDRVVTPNELWGVTGKEVRSYGDLILVPRQDYMISARLEPGPSIVPSAKIFYHSGHRVDGIYAFHGPGVRSAARRNAHIADIFPTIAVGLGLPVPQGLDGRPLREVFSEAVEIKYAGEKAEAISSSRKVLSQDEEAKIRDHLKGLGYVD